MYDMLALYEAKNVQDAVRLRLEHPEAQIIAGGTDVLVQMREGKRAGKALISIQKCDEMRGVSIDAEENIRIGSLTSFTHITNDPVIQRYINVLGEAVDMVGGPQIRNAGTIGGNTCNGVTSADSASTLHAWEAIVEITGKNGVRRVPIKDFYIKAGTVDLRVEDGELQTAILIPKASYDRTWGHYIKYAMRNAMDIATLGTSVNARLSADGKTFERVRIAFGVAGPVPMRAESAEAFINGKAVTLENIEEFGRKVLEDIHPRDSWRQQGVPQPYRRGERQAVPHRICEAGGRCAVMAKKQYQLVTCTINGREVEQMVDVRASLTDMLRNDFSLTSVKKGCEVGECGACNVLIDGECFNSCLYLAVWAEGKHITTLEGLMGPNGELSDIQQAFMEETAIQCGFCIPGFLMSAVEILDRGVLYSDDELRKLLSGHLCRCTGYENIFKAVKKTMLRRLGKLDDPFLNT